MKRIISVFSAVIVAFVFVSPGIAQDAPQTQPGQSEEQVIEEKVREMGRELSHVMLENLKVFLDQELKRLKKGRVEAKDVDQIPAYEDALKKNPKDADAHLALGRIYDVTGDGANAIIHAKKAEELFLAKKDVKGTAEARRDLRNYYEKHGFKADDFNVSK